MKTVHFFKGILLVAILGACTRTPVASNTIANSAINATTALEKSLSPQCATDGVIAQINAIKTQISAITTACDTEKAAIASEKVRWQWAFFALLIIIAAYVGKRISDNLK